MLLAGDEFLNTQNGNNNGYCQDNEITWLDWDMLNKNEGMFRFVQQMIVLRKRHPSLMRRRFLTGKMIEEKGIKDISWHGSKVGMPNWDDPEAQLIAFTLAGTSEEESDLHVVINLSNKKTTVELPIITNKRWCLIVDTSQPSPLDILNLDSLKTLKTKKYKVPDQSIVVFENVIA